MTAVLGRIQRPQELLVNETFGPTFQGEGPSAGQQAMFVRLATCNLTCTWCDTPYTWDWKRFDVRTESHRTDVGELAERVLGSTARLVVITGGEPLLQQEALVELAEILTQSGRRIEVETNGTIAPDEHLSTLVAQFNVSPKLAHSGVAETKRIVPSSLRSFAESGKAVFKFVMTAPADIEELAAVQDDHGLDPVWVMPEATTPEKLLEAMRWLADPALARGWHLGSRLHILLWGDERGR